MKLTPVEMVELMLSLNPDGSIPIDTSVLESNKLEMFSTEELVAELLRRSSLGKELE